MPQPAITPATQTLRVLFAAAEADPLIKVGGLGDVAGSLPRALRALSSEATGGFRVDARLVLPFHAGIDAARWQPRFAGRFSVPSVSGDLPAEVYTLDLDGLPVYLIKGDPIPTDGPVYAQEMSADARKFIFFSIAILELARFLDWQPHILHCNDWHTAAAAYALRLKAPNDPFLQPIRSALSVHNLPFMGKGSEQALSEFGLPPSDDPRLPWWGVHFPLVLGLLSADRIIPVSPAYAREILTPAYGCGLEDFLATRRDAITGIINGIDTQTWNPAADPLIDTPYDAAHLEKKSANKAALQAAYNFPTEPGTPMLGLITRMDPQKGVDLALDALRLVADQNWNAIIIGTGVPELEAATARLGSDLPDKVRALICYDSHLSHRIYAGADMLLMPSRYEPCGLAQMIAMRYGCVPLARATGGLRATIEDHQPGQTGTGFLFEAAEPAAFAETIRRALAVNAQAGDWRAIQHKGMAQDFSWQQSAAKYAAVYRDMIS